MKLSALQSAVCFGGYFLISVLLTWPLVLHMRSTVLRGHGDVYGDIRVIWGRLADKRGIDTSRILAAPFGTAGARNASEPVTDALLIYPARILGEVAGYNLFVLLAFPVTAFAVYLLLRRTLTQSIPAFFGGLIFGFCPATIMQATTGHLAFIQNAFLPLLLLALFYNQSRRSLRSACLVGVGYSLLTLSCLHWGYFAIYFIAFFVVQDCINHKGDRGFVLRSYWVSAIVACLIVLPFEHQWILALLPANRGVLAEMGHNNRLVELVTLSARPWEYLVPSIDHPVMGAVVENWSRIHLHGSNIHEQTLYLGFVPLLVMLYGIVIAWGRRFTPEYGPRFRIFASGALVMALMSMPPYIPIGRLKIPTLSYFAFQIAPMFRAYCRFGIWVNFFVACAAATVLAHASGQMTKLRFRSLCAALFVLLSFEYWSIPPNFAVSVQSPPPVYQWLARQPGDFIVAEYPMMPYDEAAFYTYPFWQRIHGKRLVNGAPRGDKAAWSYYEKVRDLAGPQTVRLLKEAGVRYILVHPRMYEEGEIPGPIKRYYPPLIAARTYNGGQVPSNPLLRKPYKIFGRDLVYAL